MSPHLLIDLQSVHEAFQEEILALKPPKHFEAYHDLLVETVVRQQSILNEAARAQTGEIEAFHQLIDLNNETNDRLWAALKQALKKNDIPYKELDDGVLEYRVTLDNPAKQFKYEQAKQEFNKRWNRIREEK